MKIVFIGTMDFAVPILKGLTENYDVCLVVTQPDRPFGRKQEPKPSAVKLEAIKLGIPVFQPEKIKTDYQDILDCKPDMIVVAAYGQMIPNLILDYPQKRCINVHASLLPKYRGGSPMQRAIMNGDVTTGVSVMYMEKKMDSGPILAQKKVTIKDADDVETLEKRLAIAGRDLLLETLPLVFENKIKPQDQDPSKVTFAYNIKPEEEKIDFSQSARSIFNHVRAFHPKPLCHAVIYGLKLKLYIIEALDSDLYNNKENGEIVFSNREKVYVKASKGIVSLKKVQLQGKNVMDIADFMNGTGKNLLLTGKIFK